MPRILPLLLAVLAVLYGGYWFLGRAGIEEAARGALSRPGLSHESLRTIGFPSRFDTTINQIAYEDPAGTVGWAAPFFQLFMLSYAPHRVIAVWPDRQSLRLGRTEIDIRSDRMRASGEVGLSASAPLRQATFEAEGITLATNIGDGAIARLLLAIRQVGPGTEAESGHRYDIFAEGSGLGFGMTASDADAAVPASVRIDGLVTLDAPIDRHLAPLRPTGVEIATAQLRWDGLSLLARGAASVGPDLALTGSGVIEISDPARLARLLEDAGLIRPEAGAALVRALEAASRPDGAATVPVELRAGRIVVAGIAIPLEALSQRQ